MPVAAVAALAIILTGGALAEWQNRDLTRQTQRADATAVVERLRTRLDNAIGTEVRLLAGIAGAAAAAGDIKGVDFRRLVTALGRQSDALRALALASGSGEIAVHVLRAGEVPALDGVLSAGASDQAGSRLMPAAGRSTLALWTPLPAGSDQQAPGRAVAIVDTETLFAAAGLGDPDTGLAFALTAAESGAPPGTRAVYLGHAAVLDDDPVSADVAVPGGDWRLAAAPSGGWATRADAAWPIRILTLLSAGLVAGPILRTRRLLAERRRQAAELATLSRRLGLALDASQVGVWDYDIDRDDLVWDARMDELYGLSGDITHRTYRDWRDRLHPDDLDRAEAEFLAATRDGNRYDSNYRVRLSDGSVRHIRAIGALYREPGGTAKIVGVNWDVTADAWCKSELEAGRHEAEVASVAKSEFLATMGHEIRSPMTGLTGMLDLLLRTELDREQRERAQIARDSAQHLLAILDDLLDLSRIEANRVVLAPAEVDVARMAEDVVVLVSAGIPGREPRLFASFDGPLPTSVVCDPKRLRQVLLNLVGNAAKFTETGSVELRLGHEPHGGGRLCVAVRDTGIGIPDEARSGLFQRFVQVESQLAPARGGAGLGLAISKELVELMGGEICVYSVPGLGSTFRFWIPAPAVDATAAALGTHAAEGIRRPA